MLTPTASLASAETAGRTLQVGGSPRMHARFALLQPRRNRRRVRSPRGGAGPSLKSTLGDKLGSVATAGDFPVESIVWLRKPTTGWVVALERLAPPQRARCRPSAKVGCGHLLVSPLLRFGFSGTGPANALSFQSRSRGRGRPRRRRHCPGGRPTHRRSRHRPPPRPRRAARPRGPRHRPAGGARPGDAHARRPRGLGHPLRGRDEPRPPPSPPRGGRDPAADLARGDPHLRRAGPWSPAG